ncbi:MAG: hypothetical protein M1827_005103 [Pycnora praestabilis]|nr:MAG: hypothetical protein M1827_005103 [Pycnora praestabilis]
MAIITGSGAGYAERADWNGPVSIVSQAGEVLQQCIDGQGIGGYAMIGEVGPYIKVSVYHVDSEFAQILDIAFDCEEWEDPQAYAFSTSDEEDISENEDDEQDDPADDLPDGVSPSDDDSSSGGASSSDDSAPSNEPSSPSTNTRLRPDNGNEPPAQKPKNACYSSSLQALSDHRFASLPQTVCSGMYCGWDGDCGFHCGCEVVTTMQNAEKVFGFAYNLPEQAIHRCIGLLPSVNG